MEIQQFLEQLTYIIDLNIFLELKYAIERKEFTSIVLTIYS